MIPNRAFFGTLSFGGITGEFGRAMANILVRRSGEKIPMARSTDFDMPQKSTKKARFGIYLTQISIAKTSAASGRWHNIS